MSMFIYYPFIRSIDKEALEREHAASEENLIVDDTESVEI